MNGVVLDERRDAAPTPATPAQTASRPPFWLADLGGLLAGLAVLFGGAVLLSRLIDPSETEPPRQDMQVRSLPPPKAQPLPARPSAERPRPTRAQPVPTPPLPQLALPALDQALELPAIASQSDRLTWDPSAPALPALPAVSGNGNGDRPARCLSTAAEVVHHYPRRARRRGIEGRSTVRVRLDAQGQVTQVEVLQSEPAGVFERAARRAARQLRYEPAIVDGQAVATQVEETFVWSLR